MKSNRIMPHTHAPGATATTEALEDHLWGAHAFVGVSEMLLDIHERHHEMLLDIRERHHELYHRGPAPDGTVWCSNDPVVYHTPGACRSELGDDGEMRTWDCGGNETTGEV
jgi:hypothetical protein